MDPLQEAGDPDSSMAIDTGRDVAIDARSHSKKDQG